jgi:hypothetical protein
MSILISATMASRSSAPTNGLISPTNISSVRITAICPITLFPDLMPLFMNSNNIPAITGIKAVKDGLSDEKYPHVPRVISKTALIRLARCDFIVNSFIELTERSLKCLFVSYSISLDLDFE